MVFRADASLQIGTGHVMRCITLAGELTRLGHTCSFICREHQGHLGDYIVEKGYSVTLLPAPLSTDVHLRGKIPEDYACWLGVPWQIDCTQSLCAIEASNPDWLVVDHYALDARWERSVAHAVNKIMVIDDLANRPHECSVLLDQNLGRLPSDYDALVPFSCKRFIGPRYALLRPEFVALRSQSLARREHPKINRILISLGGVDQANVTGEVLTAFSHSSLPASTELDIVMGPSAPHLSIVRQQAAGSRFRTEVIINAQDMAERMHRADLSIGAAGSTSWERCCMGLPSVTIVLAENQRGIAEALAISKAALIIDGQPVKEKLVELLNYCSDNFEALYSLSRCAAQVCDGVGAILVATTLAKENQ